MDSVRAVSFPQDTSRAASVLRNRETDDIYNGDLSLKQEPLYKTVRIYISSELSDSIVEKRHLAAHVYPRLRQFCHFLGLQCVVVDLFREVPSTMPLPTPQALSDSMAYELETRGLLEMARDEIKLCQEVSVGPTFVTLLAQRYGHKALHKHIPERDFKLLLAAIDDHSMRQLVTQWYRQDTNALPPQYVLQSRSGMSHEEWKSIHQSLSRTTRKAAKVALGKDISKAQHYTMSVIEEEVCLGIFNMTKDPNQSCLWLKRTFTDLQEQRPSGDRMLAAYTDLVEGKRGAEFDQETLKILNHLKEARMPAKYVGLDSTNIFEFSLKWAKGKGVDTETHTDYLTQLSEQLLTALQSMVTSGFTGHLQNSDGVTHEILCHASYCKRKSLGFMDRPPITSRILDYLGGSSMTPLVLHGCVGSGKTSLMAGVACMLGTVSSLKRAAIVLRFIRATPNAQCVRHLLLDICKQLRVIYKQEIVELPKGYRSLCEALRRLLAFSSSDKPLILLLDGVDELSPEDGALGLSWLPLHLPEHVKIVLSTSSETKYSCFPVLQSLLSTHQENFIEVAELSSSDCKQLLNHSLKIRGRMLMGTQEKVVLDTFLKYRNPLYLQFLLREVTLWHSYQWNSSWTPITDLSGITKQFFSDVEDRLGRVFTRSALGYITASRDGLTEMELLDVLSCDDEVMQEVNQKWRPLHTPTSDTHTLTAIPPLLTAMFHRALRPLLDYHSGCGGSLVLRWSHHHLHEAAVSAYLSYPPTAQARYNTLANYFAGGLLQRTADEADGEKLHFEQPVVVSDELGLYNVRKLHLLPHLLTLARRHYELQRLLVDYEWLKASIVSISVLDLVAEFAAVLPLVPLARSAGASDSQYELVLLRDALSQSVEALCCDQLCLSSQLLGRLLPHVRGSSPWQWPNLKRILLRAFDDYCPAITPLHPLYHLPGGPLLVTMEGHRGLITSLASTVVRRSADNSLSMIVISSSEDKTLKSWDVKSTGVIKTFDGHTDKVLSVALTLNGRYAASGSADNTVRHWLVATAECLCMLRGHRGAVSAVVLTSDGQKIISGSSDKTIKIWNTDIESNTYGQVIFTLTSETHSPLTALTLCEDVWAVALCEDGRISLTDIISGEGRSVVGRERVTAITTARVEWFKYLLTGTQSGQVVVRDWVSMETSRVLQPPNEEEPVLAIAAGHKVVAAYKHMGLVVWDILSGSYLYSLTGQEGVVHTCTLADQGNLIVTGGDDQRVRIWDLKRSGDNKTTTQHKGDVLSIALSPCGNYGLSAGLDSMVIIYELTTMKIMKKLRAEAVSKVYAMRDGKHFLTSSSDECVQLWDGERGEVVREFSCYDDGVTCVDVTMNAELLVVGGESGKLTFWGVASGEKLKTLSSHSDSVVFVSFAKGTDFNYILSTCRSGEVCVRNFLTGKVVLQTHINSSEITCSAVSPNAALLAMGCEDTTCRIISIPSGQRLVTLTGHKLAVTSVSFLSNNTQCLTGSLDKTIRLFNTSTGECCTVFQTDLPITCISSDSRGEMIMYGTVGGWVSMAYHQSSASGVNPIVKELKGIASSSMSSASTESKTSVGSQGTENAASEILEAEEQFVYRMDEKAAVSTADSADYPIDVVIEVVNGNRNESLSSSENSGKIEWQKNNILQVTTTEDFSSAPSNDTDKLSASSKQAMEGMQEHEHSSRTDSVHVVKSSACLVL
ncbi:NACHT domain- and WD repeat-containing protein 1-like isoform X1 [Halichondria panicea]|uniref:NACHT domain- and WD repeat-containing protein 1-like isoform X1 n=1 Tax=Halichondria panicea TaxID=6063 RepID=UPI00312B3E6F